MSKPTPSLELETARRVLSTVAGLPPDTRPGDCIDAIQATLAERDRQIAELREIRKQCGHTLRHDPHGTEYWCALDAFHDGPHRTHGGAEWCNWQTEDDRERMHAATCVEPLHADFRTRIAELEKQRDEARNDHTKLCIDYGLQSAELDRVVWTVLLQE